MLLADSATHGVGRVRLAVGPGAFSSYTHFSSYFTSRYDRLTPLACCGPCHVVFGNKTRTIVRSFEFQFQISSSSESPPPPGRSALGFHTTL